MNDVQLLVSSRESSASGEDRLRALIDNLANQMCQAVDGRFDFRVKVQEKDETLEKLQMLINFLIDSARRSLAEAKTRERDLDARTEMLADSNMRLHREIDERRQVQRTLRENEDHIRAIMNAAADAILTINDQGIVETINDAGEKMFGYSAAELIGMNISKLAAKPHDARHDSYIQAYLETGRANIIGLEREAEAVRKDGTIFPIALRVSEMRYKEQRWFVGSIQDISERRQAETERERLHQKLLEVSRHAGMAEVATGVLHNVGNVLNSVNVSASLVAEKVRSSSLSNVSLLSDMFTQHRDDLGAFFAHDEKAKLIPAYLEELGQHLAEEQAFILEELATLDNNLSHIKDVVSIQQTFAKVSGLTEIISLQEVFEDAIRINSAALVRHDIQIVREFEDLPPQSIDRHRVIQILVNLISNAKYALSGAEHGNKTLTLRLARSKQDQDCVVIEVADNGCGIHPDNLTRIFSHGFTTRSDGHGFGLHSSSLSAGMLGGLLSVSSDGPGKGAVFTLTLPIQPREEEE